jgi:hypothetical protein
MALVVELRKGLKFLVLGGDLLNEEQKKKKTG